MVSVQAECRVEDALQLMAERAAVQGMTIEQIAQAVVDHNIRFGLDAH
jgi:alkylhydroperoxidase/carboxymuconolactone decarboxylase family protein YurZ